ncbi:hypothetical protein LR48_Vigan04g138200 [Vigna angularis]|uniref:Uncharacterized protein n=1 Tax=Phaseolus angularis TaxID=3914 RepID=A0A0L9UF62_PHAAN|nr:hypothetical protein LR48_Vigan04g138200 [Vigna angularis]
MIPNSVRFSCLYPLPLLGIRFLICKFVCIRSGYGSGVKGGGAAYSAWHKWSWKGGSNPAVAAEGEGGWIGDGNSKGEV